MVSQEDKLKKVKEYLDESKKREKRIEKYQKSKGKIKKIEIAESFQQKIVSDINISEKIKNNKIWMYYDFESLTQDKVDSELTRLHKEVEKVETTLIYMGEDPEEHSDIMEFYEERGRIRDQLNAIYEFLSVVRHERIDDLIKNDELERLYGKLPHWRVEQLKEKKNLKILQFKA
ncbi:hypothetical protein LCGC14_2621650 [marine sediment metagenome]|uniref:Uncharacterized protein n=1 Tax=marine sediment metagenome TaxID=412755 RepID=A0A0F9A318_9ZZZZ